MVIFNCTKTWRWKHDLFRITWYSGSRNGVITNDGFPSPINRWCTVIGVITRWNYMAVHAGGLQVGTCIFRHVQQPNPVGGGGVGCLRTSCGTQRTPEADIRTPRIENPVIQHRLITHPHNCYWTCALYRERLWSHPNGVEISPLVIRGPWLHSAMHFGHQIFFLRLTRPLW